MGWPRGKRKIKYITHKGRTMGRRYGHTEEVGHPVRTEATASVER